MAIRFKVNGVSVEADSGEDAAALLRALNGAQTPPPQPTAKHEQQREDEHESPAGGSGWNKEAALRMHGSSVDSCKKAIVALASTQTGELTTKELATQIGMADAKGIAAILASMKRKAKEMARPAPYTKLISRNGTGRAVVVKLTREFQRAVKEAGITAN